MLNKSTISQFVVPLANKQTKKNDKKENFHGESDGGSDVCFMSTVFRIAQF